MEGGSHPCHFREQPSEVLDTSQVVSTSPLGVFYFGPYNRALNLDHTKIGAPSLM